MGWFATLVREKEDSQKVIEWGITSKCNLRCKHCYMGSDIHTQYEDLNYEDKIELANRISKQANNVVISGGEPLLLNNLFEILKIMTPSCNVFLATNGTIYNDETVKKIKEAGVKSVQVSIDYLEEDLHDEFRGVKGSWKKSMQFINAVINAGIPVITCMTVMKNNYKSIEKYVRTMKSIGVNFVYLTRFTPVGVGKKYKDLAIKGEAEKDFLVNYLKPLLQTNKEYVSTNIPQWNLYVGTMSEDSVGCSMGHMLFINSSGIVSPCPMVDISLGNIKDNSFEELYEKKIMCELKSREKIGGVCASCKYLRNCSGCCAWSDYEDMGMFNRNNCWIKQQFEQTNRNTSGFST